MLVVDVVDPNFIALTPKLCNAKLYHFQAVFDFVDGVDENIAGCGLFVCK